MRNITDQMDHNALTFQMGLNVTYLEVTCVTVPARVRVERIRGENGSALAPEASGRPNEGLVLRWVAAPRAAAVEVPPRL